MTLDDLPTFDGIHALPEVAWYLGRRPRSRQGSAAFLRTTLETYEKLALDYLAAPRKEDVRGFRTVRETSL